MVKPSDSVAEVRALVNILSASLPDRVDVIALGVKSMAPYLMLCAREALMWRTEELARNACDALERDDYAATAILARGVTESAAMMWTLKDALDGRGNRTPQQLHDFLMKLLMGSSSWPDFPRRVHVNDMLDKIEKSIPNFKASYDRLSEVAHPNWSGVAGMFSKTDYEERVTHFGRGNGVADQKMYAFALSGSLGAFIYAYDHVGDEMPKFLSELETFEPGDTAAK